MIQNLHTLRNSEKITILFLFIVVTSQSMVHPYFYLNWIFGGILIVAFSLKILSKNNINKRAIYSFLLSNLWLLVPIVTSVGNNIIDLNDHFKYLFLYVFYSTVSVIVVHSILSIKEEKRHAIFFLINKIWLLLNGISFIIYIFANDIYGSSIFSGIVENRNIFAIVTSILASYLIFFKYSYNNKSAKFFIVISFFLVLSTLSIKGLVGWLLLFALSNLWNSNISINRRQKNVIFIVLFLIVLFTLLIAIENPLVNRVERFVMVYTSPNELRINESAYLRNFYFRESVELIKKHPMNGVGIRNSKYYLIPPLLKNAGADVGTYSHNNYLEILLSGGLIAFVLYYLPFLFAICRLSNKKRISTTANYLLLLGIYKLFIDFGSVNYDVLIMNILFVAVLYGQFINERKCKNVN